MLAVVVVVGRWSRYRVLNARAYVSEIARGALFGLFSHAPVKISNSMGQVGLRHEAAAVTRKVELAPIRGRPQPHMTLRGTQHSLRANFAVGSTHKTRWPPLKTIPCKRVFVFYK
jgi:hypothetical protein